MNKSSLIRLIVLIVGLSTGACFKEYSENFAEEQLIIENAALGQQEADDVLEVVYQSEVIQQLYPNQAILVNSCAKISNDLVNKVLTIDFGGDTTTCNAFFGRTRQGKILASYSSTIGDTLGSRVLTFDGYRVNNKSIEGTVSLHDVLPYNDTLLQASRTMTDFKVSFANGTSVTFNGTLNRIWTSGMRDTVETNNVYSLSGTISGVSANRSFTQDIVEVPVLISFDCAAHGFFPRTAGVLELSKLDGYPDRKRRVDYGDSTCTDNAVKVETFRRTYGITAD